MLSGELPVPADGRKEAITSSDVYRLQVGMPRKVRSMPFVYCVRPNIVRPIRPAGGMVLESRLIVVPITGRALARSRSGNSLNLAAVYVAGRAAEMSMLVPGLIEGPASEKPTIRLFPSVLMVWYT